jgi:GNAT superfamily N-acetyltransferase
VVCRPGQPALPLGQKRWRGWERRGMVGRMDIVECRAEDVVLLDECLPSGGATSFHAGRFTRQVAGSGTFLVAWVEGRPVGTGEVRWDGCAAPEVQAEFADCPEINGLHVVEPLRGTGIGTALIHHAERLAVDRGRRTIGLGVDHDNPRAAALYARLGYRPMVRYVDRWTYTDRDGVGHDEEAHCVFLVKDLADPLPQGS